MTAIAIGTSYSLIKQYNKKVRLRRSLERVKQLFSDQNDITGSWLEDEPRIYQHEDFKTKAYFGGLIRKSHGQLLEYEFVLSAKSYALLDLKLIA
ncbi:hypothetical protein FC62_GL001400 [Amylolactobacillus amylotrophicus DSM 20534]|nr:hypothetical protein [Amylolactobacillus amylophilus]KRK37285.1 hypothetical protein FC62_GL001400 [Amylolactobacillus amylotrophicus DSM 20534]